MNIHVQPRLLAQLFGLPNEELSPELRRLIPGKSHSQYVFSPKTTGAIRAVVRQIIDCPFSGTTKRLYLQGKILELITLQLSGVMEGDAGQRPQKLRPDTVARLHQVAAIVRSRLENPPSQTELARAVGMSDRTLRRGFKQLFGMTVVGYLTQQRIEQAEQTLRMGNCTVAEVANRVGYAHLGHFAAAFKRHFGITPSQCLQGNPQTVMTEALVREVFGLDCRIVDDSVASMSLCIPIGRKVTANTHL